MRRVDGLETFNVLWGGEYFFLPSLTALGWLGMLARLQGRLERKSLR